MKTLFMLLIAMGLCSAGWAQTILTGQVLAQDGKFPLPGATIKIKETSLITVSDQNGQFSLKRPAGEITLVITFTGYETKQQQVGSTESSVVVTLRTAENQLNEVVVSTGYQKIPKERATGSFVQIDNQLVNRRVSTGILNRLEDVTSGLIFNRDASVSGTTDISIRGRSTIYANASPLIVIDNFPYDGDINNINPNDVESITVLKDAAAASIWGARAGNGVIVITTKKGKYNRPVQVNANANVTVGNKPNQFYLPRMTSSDFIDVERNLFSTGFYDGLETAPDHPAVSPVVQLLFDARNVKITAQQAQNQIDALRNIDVRNDFDKYFNRKSVNQQYALNVTGGGANNNFMVSGGYDRNLDNLVGNRFSRATLNASQSFYLIDHKLEVTTGIYYTANRQVQNNPGTNAIVNSSGYLYPYAQLADGNGNALAIQKDYNRDFTNAALASGLLDWSYRPLDEIRLADNTTDTRDYRLNGSANYKIIPMLTAGVSYQYQRSTSEFRNQQSQSAYYTRDLINNFSVVNADGSVTRNIPAGGILDFTNSKNDGYNLRTQLAFNDTWTRKHHLNAIAGYEIRDFKTSSIASRLYGYDAEHASSRPVDYINYYNLYYYPGAVSQIPYVDVQSLLTDRYRSYYGNAAYTYDKRFIVSASARIDQSNLFGVNTNQKGVPLWSAGLAWNISNEKFYHLAALSYLKMRLSYGYNGNVDKTVSAYTTGTFQNSAFNTGLPYIQIKTAANPELRWEKVQVTNLGIDFATAGNRFQGTLELYRKNGRDLIGNMIIPPSTGFTSFRGNNANTRTDGLDLTLNTLNLDQAVKWYSTLLFSINRDRVTSYAVASTSRNYVGVLGTPYVGRPLYGIYSYPWEGLDHASGDPIGSLNGGPSKNYAAITAADPSALIFNGPARPTVYGSFRNTVTYRGISLSANISYRLGYYFRQPSVSMSAVSQGIPSNGDYALRWQQPGDELTTHVPSLPAAADPNRDFFYQYASVLVQKGDHVRLQDISVSYDLPASMLGASFRTAQVYLYANNLSILWKATKTSLDPDYTLSNPPVRTIALGLKAGF